MKRVLISVEVVDIEREWRGINLGLFSLDIYYYNLVFNQSYETKLIKSIQTNSPIHVGNVN